MFVGQCGLVARSVAFNSGDMGFIHGCAGNFVNDLGHITCTLCALLSPPALCLIYLE